MLDEHLKSNIRKLENQLKIEEKKYTNAIRDYQDYNARRAIRNKIYNAKEELDKLYILKDQ